MLGKYCFKHLYFHVRVPPLVANMTLLVYLLHIMVRQFLKNTNDEFYMNIPALILFSKCLMTTQLKTDSFGHQFIDPCAISNKVEYIGFYG